MGPKGPNPVTGQNYTATGSGHGGFSHHGVLAVNTRTRMADITDGTSNTLAVGEISYRTANCYRPWTRGWDGTAMGTNKTVLNAINAVPYNGSNNFNDVSFISDNVDMGVYRATASRNGAEPQTVN